MAYDRLRKPCTFVLTIPALATLYVGCAPVQVGSSLDPDVEGGRTSTRALGGAASAHPELAGAGGVHPASTGTAAGGMANAGATGSGSPSFGGRAGVGGTSSANAGGALAAAAGATRQTEGGTMSAGGFNDGATSSGGGNSAHAGATAGGPAAASTGGATSGGAPSGGVPAGGTSGTGVAGSGSAGVGSTESAGTAGVAGMPPACSDGDLEIRGRALWPSGAPLTGVEVTLAGQANATTMTDSNGRYVFGQICPGAYSVTPSHRDLHFCGEQVSYANLTKNVDDDFIGSSSGCLTPEIEQRVLLLIFDPYVTTGTGAKERLSKVKQWEDPAELAAQYQRTMESATNGRIRYDIAKTTIVDAFPQKIDGYSYNESSYQQCLTDSAFCHTPDAADYQTIVQDQAICADVTDSVIDEVWLLGGPSFGFPASQRIGPQSVASLAPDWPLIETSCTRVTNVFGFNYERGLDAMLQAQRIHSEVILDQIYGGWSRDSIDTSYNRFSLVDAQSPSYEMSGCGGHGYAPNSTNLYEYDSSSSVLSYCDAFYNYPASSDPSVEATAVTCDAWGCSGIGYQRYWMRHLPSAKGIGTDGKLADWWRYLLRPDDAMTTGRVTCSSSYETGWCDQVTDGLFGECNTGEWATAHRPTGWVEFSWPLVTSIATVKIYDRACDEQVVRGHLEFSDGSASIPFGPLADTGMDATTITLPSTKQLSWLRVVIDECFGGQLNNPGFGEITLE